MDVPLTIVIVVIGPLLAFVGTLIIVNLRSIKSCITNIVTHQDRQDDVIKALTKSQAACKIDCERQFVSGELFLRETGFQRRAIEKLSASINRIEGKLVVVDKMPQIAGDIARAVVKEFKNGENQK